MILEIALLSVTGSHWKNFLSIWFSSFQQWITQQNGFPSTQIPCPELYFELSHLSFLGCSPYPHFFASTLKMSSMENFLKRCEPCWSLRKHKDTFLHSFWHKMTRHRVPSVLWIASRFTLTPFRLPRNIMLQCLQALVSGVIGMC